MSVTKKGELTVHKLDASFDYAAKIDQLLHKSEVARDLDAEAEADPDETAAGPDGPT